MKTTMDASFTTALRNELTSMASAAPRRARRRVSIAASAAVLLGIGGVAVASLRPATEIAAMPLTAPFIVNGVGPALVRLPLPPTDATYLHFELICFDGIVCASPSGSVEGPGLKVERGALPLKDEVDPSSPLLLPGIRTGFDIAVDAGTHWRLYGIYIQERSPKTAPLADGRTLGIPSPNEMPNLVPAQTTTGELGWIDYNELTINAEAILTGEGVRQAPLNVYSGDGTTVIGKADVSQAWGQR